MTPGPNIVDHYRFCDCILMLGFDRVTPMDSPTTRISHVPQRVTPLWIVAAFLSTAEAATLYAITRVTGSIQLTLTVFVVVFTLAVACAFFAIIWCRPYNFYAPGEYGNVKPKEFIESLRNAPALQEQVKLAQSVSENPEDSQSRFALIATMAEEAHLQWIILMHEKRLSIVQGAEHLYLYKRGGGGTGSFSNGGRNNLAGTGLIDLNSLGHKVTLTEEGHKFAKWLLANGRKCDVFMTDYGGWGDVPDGHPMEQWAVRFRNPRPSS